MNRGISDAFQRKVEQMVYLVREKGEVTGLVFGPMNDVRSSERDIQYFATGFGNIPVRIDKNMKPNEWAMVMGEMDAGERKAAAVKELEMDLHNFLNIAKVPGTTYRPVEILEQLTRAVLILMERTDRKDGIK